MRACCRKLSKEWKGEVMFYLLPAQERGVGGNGARASNLDMAQAVHPYVEHANPGAVTG